jgi:uncharacterized protein (DUF1810 family)
MTDPFDLQRFVAAQDPLYAAVLAELRASWRPSRERHTRSSLRRTI